MNLHFTYMHNFYVFMCALYAKSCRFLMPLLRHDQQAIKIQETISLSEVLQQLRKLLAAQKKVTPHTITFSIITFWVEIIFLECDGARKCLKPNKEKKTGLTDDLPPKFFFPFLYPFYLPPLCTIAQSSCCTPIDEVW